MTVPGVDRRELLKAALAMGGSGALSACLELEGRADVPTGGDPSALPERQYAWNEFLPTGGHGNPKLPNHQLVLFLRYRGQGPPTEADRNRVESALRSLERAYQWGTGDEFNPTKTRGVLFFVGYAPRYFDRFDVDSLPDAVPRPPQTLIDDLDGDATPDRADAVVVLTSGRVSVILSAEQALRGRFDRLNGTPVEAALTDTFSVVDRRTGFLGAGRPTKEFDADIPEESPTAMGYRSSFRDNQATEDRVAIISTPFTDGTTLQVSRLVFDLDAWYEYDEPERVDRMFSPAHTPEQVGDIGEHLGGRSRISRETAQRTLEDAEAHNLVGHTQKTAAARTDEFEPKILRRSEGLSTDLDEPAMNFMSVQRAIEDFVDVRRAMDCPATANFAGPEGHAGGQSRGDAGGQSGGQSGGNAGDRTGCPAHVDVPEENDGITGFIETLTRGTYLVPPRSLRALPAPNPAGEDQ